MKKKKAFTLAERIFAQRPGEQHAAAKHAENKFPSSGEAAAEQTGNEFPSFGGVPVRAGWLKAFTLAEVLISLTIIGVIAAITVPSLIQRTNKQEYAAALQKAYSTFSRATQMIIAENGTPGGADSWASSIDKIQQEYIKHLNVKKVCRGEGGCFPQYKGNQYMTFLNGTKLNWTPNVNWSPNHPTYRSLILDDGMQVLLHNFANNSSYINCSGTQRCANIIIDVNGEKGPDIFGRDIFWFQVTPENGFIPDNCDSKNCKGGNGTSCACIVLNEGAMNY